MEQKAKLKKRIRYGMNIFEEGDVGDIVTVAHPLTFQEQPIYDYYVKFDKRPPIGVFNTEVEILEENI